MNKSLLATSALALLTISTQVLADSPGSVRWPRWYVGLSGDVDFLQSTDIKGAKTGSVDYNEGGEGNVALGYMPPFTGVFSGLRFEVEGGYHYNTLDTAIVNNASVVASGHVQAISYLGNAYYDFRNSSAFTPYVGAGAGGARVNLSRDSGLGNTQDHDNVFAYQFMAGIGFTPMSIPMTQWTLGYRYFTAQNPQFNSAAGKIKLDNLQSNNVELGAKFRF